MVRILPHINNLKSYSPGKTPEEYRAEFGFTETAMLWNNENNLGVPKKAVERIQSAAHLVNKYPDPVSTDLRKSIAQLNNVLPENVVVGNGSESILANLFQAFCGEKDQMITCSGTFVAVYIWAQSHNVEGSKIPLNDDYGFDLNAILNRITERTKLIYISNANNPTGTAVGETELKAFVDQIPEDILVVIDEAYFEYSRDLMPDYPDTTRWKRDNVITLRTFSKAYGLAGIRLGYAVGHKDLIKALDKVRMTFEPSLITQQAGIGALEDTDFLSRTVALNSEWLPQFKDLADEKGLKQSDACANFIMIDLETESRAEQLTVELLKKGVFVRRLPAFGLPSCIRISTGNEEENEYFKKIFSDVSV